MNGEIKRAIHRFTAGLLKDWGSDGMCFAACTALQGYLSVAHGLETKLTCGEIGEIATGDQISEHYWLELLDGSIIDPTADQFNSSGYKMPKIYIGHRPAHYKEKASPAPRR